MPIVVCDNPSYSYPISVAMPGDNGQVVESKFTVCYKRVDEDELAALLAKLRSGEMDDRAFLGEVLVGWGADVIDAAGKPLQFNKDNLNGLLKIRGVLPKTVEGFFDSQNEAAAKNLKTPPSLASAAAPSEATTS